MSEGFLQFCETLWQSWLEDRLSASPFAGHPFDLDAAPEPYLLFGSSKNALVALTTNPGKSMSHQRRDTVLAGEGPVNARMSYAMAAAAFGAFYEKNLKGPARRRIADLRLLAGSAGFDGIVQVEACPFHSRSFPTKGAFLRSLPGDAMLSGYVAHLREFLRDRPVLVISAISSATSLSAEVHLSPWLSWQVDLVGLDRPRSEFLPLIERGGKVTSAALISGSGAETKTLALMMGGNHLPGETSLRILADALRAHAAGQLV